MNIGIIGAGNIGFAVAQLSAGAHHSIALSNHSGPASLTESIQRLGLHVRATSVEEAAAFGDIMKVVACRSLALLSTTSLSRLGRHRNA